jgi:hypothetical protein
MPNNDEIYDLLKNFDRVSVEYSGSNDEGYIGAITGAIGEQDNLELPSEMDRIVHDWAYDALEESYGGWEIDAGSSGEFTIKPKERVTLLKHGTHEITTKWDTVHL